MKGILLRSVSFHRYRIYGVGWSQFFNKLKWEMMTFMQTQCAVTLSFSSLDTTHSQPFSMLALPEDIDLDTYINRFHHPLASG